MSDQQQPSSSEPQPQQPDLNKQEETATAAEQEPPRNDFAPVRWVDPSNKNADETTTAGTKQEAAPRRSSASLRAQEEENLRYLKWKAEQDAKERQIVSDNGGGGAQNNNNDEEEIDIEEVKRRRRQEQLERERREEEVKQQQNQKQNQEQQQNQEHHENQQLDTAVHEEYSAHSLVLDAPVFDYQDTHFLSQNFFEQFTISADEDDETDFEIRQALFFEHVIDLKKTEQQLKFQALLALHAQFARVKLWFACLAAKQRTEWLEAEARWVLMGGFHAMKLRIKKKNYFAKTITRYQRRINEAKERQLAAAQEQAQVRAVYCGTLAREPRTLACALQVLLQAQEVRDLIRAEEKEARRKFDCEFRASQYAAKIHELDRENLVVLAARQQRKKRWEQLDPFLVRRRMPLVANAGMVFVPAPPPPSGHHQNDNNKKERSLKSSFNDNNNKQRASSPPSSPHLPPPPGLNVFGGSTRYRPGVSTQMGNSVNNLNNSPNTKFQSSMRNDSMNASTRNNNNQRPHSSPAGGASRNNPRAKMTMMKQQQLYNQQRPQSSGGGRAVVRRIFDDEDDEHNDGKENKNAYYRGSDIGASEAAFLQQEDKNSTVPPHRTNQYKDKSYVRGFSGAYDQEWYPVPPATAKKSSHHQQQQQEIAPETQHQHELLRGSKLTEKNSNISNNNETLSSSSQQQQQQTSKGIKVVRRKSSSTSVTSGSSNKPPRRESYASDAQYYEAFMKYNAQQDVGVVVKSSDQSNRRNLEMEDEL